MGKRGDKLPFVLSSVQLGEHLVRVVKEGCQQYEERVSVTEGERKKVIVSLQRIVGGLSIRREPSGAKVYIDGKQVGTSPHEAKDLSLNETNKRTGERVDEEKSRGELFLTKPLHFKYTGFGYPTVLFNVAIDIYGQFVDGDGNRLFTLPDENLAISSASNGQRSPSVARGVGIGSRSLPWRIVARLSRRPM